MKRSVPIACFHTSFRNPPMPRSSSWLNHHGPRSLRAAAVCALAVGAGVWGARLLAPAPQEIPPLLSAGAAQRQSVQPVAQWFGGRPLRVRVSVAGIIAADGGRGAALLSVDGAPVRVWRVGQALAPGVVLQSVTGNAVSIAQDGTVEQFSVPAGPGSGLRGFIPVAPD